MTSTATNFCSPHSSAASRLIHLLASTSIVLKPPPRGSKVSVDPGTATHLCLQRHPSRAIINYHLTEPSPLRFYVQTLFMYFTKTSTNIATCKQKFPWIPSSFISKRALRIFPFPDFSLLFTGAIRQNREIGNQTGHSISYGNHHHIYKGGNTKVARAALSIHRIFFICITE